MNLPYVETLLHSLEHVRATGANKWQACCPGHEDRQASLSIGIGREENVLLKCFAGCDLDTILRGLGKTAADLYPPKAGAPLPPPEALRPGRPRTQEKTAVKTAEKTAEKTARARLVATYDYTEEAGGLLYQVCRYDPKEFRQRRPNGADGWAYNLKDIRRVLYRLPDVLRAVGAGETVFLPEGEKDCETLRAWGLAATTNAMGAEAPWLAEYSEALRAANVVILPDNDAPGRKCCDRRGQALQAVCADVRVLALPDLADKGDVSDWAQSGGTKETLLRLAASAPRWKEAEPTQTAAQEEEASDDYALPYQETPAGLVWLRVTRDGKARTPLTNFTARILADILEDDGAETSLRYRLQARRGERAVTFTIPAASFDGFGWVAEHLGIGAACYPGALMKEHAGFAIRQLSEAAGATRETTFTHTGWREVRPGCWGYLHAGGVIAGEQAAEGAEGADAANGLSVRLADAWAGYALPAPPTGETLQQAVKASLNMTLLASPALTFPLLAAVYRAAVGSADFSLSLSGPSGAFKSELASLAQRHYGAGMNASNLPGSWSSTENALEELAFRVKDALLVIDDFAPTGGANDIARLHAKADRVLRAQGNGSGRQRMRRDGSLHAARPPRGLILSTGEDIPQGKSLRARQFILEVGPKDVDAARLSMCQKDAGDGLYAQCMAGFLAWYAPRYEVARQSYCTDMERLRAQAYAEGGRDAHRRLPEIVADLWQGLSYFLQFAHFAGALTETEKWDWYERGKKAILQAAQTQAVHQQASDPATRFLDLIRSALSSGAAHVADMEGTRPDAANAWGWRQGLVGTGQFEAVRWEPKGERIGWTDGDSLYLEKDAAFKVARSQSGDSDGVPLTQTVLYKRLLEGGHLSSTEKNSTRGTLHIRKRAEKKLQNVLHLPASALLCGKSDISDISDIEPDSE